MGKIGEAAVAYRHGEWVGEEKERTLGHTLNRLDAWGLVMIGPAGW
jgi:hypothetical protein